MSKRTASLRYTTVLLAATGTAALLLGAPAATTTRAADAAVKITATDLIPVPNPALAFNVVADAMGLFKKHGIDWVEGPKLGGGGPSRVQAVATGATDVAVSDIVSAMGGIYSGADLKVLMVMTPYGDGEIWGQNKYKTLQDAKGQPWGVASLAGAQRFNAQMTVEGMGMKPDAFRYTAIAGSDGNRLEALVTGRTQLACLTHLGAQLAISKGYTNKVHVVVKHTAKYTPPIPRLVVIAKESWIKSHPDAATRYVEAMLEEGRTSENDAKTWVTVGHKVFHKSGMTEKQLQEAWQDLHDGGWFTINGGVNLAGSKRS